GRNCLFLATDDQELLSALALVDLWREGAVEPVRPPPRPAHIFAQQVMALALQLGGVTRPDLGLWLGHALDGIAPTDRDAILAHMLGTGILSEDGGILGFGPVGEREFGRRHFSDLVAAFTEPMVLAVRHGPIDIGTV